MISLVVPAYNEASRIHSTLQGAVDYFDARRLAYEVIVSADGTDGTREAARALGQTNSAIKVIGKTRFGAARAAASASR